MEPGITTTWAGVEYPQSDALPVGPPSRGSFAIARVARLATPTVEPYFGRPAEDRLACTADPLDDFDDDDFDDEFDDDFEEEWDEELPGDADQFEPDEKEADGTVEVEPDFDDED